MSYSSKTRSPEALTFSTPSTSADAGNRVEAPTSAQFSTAWIYIVRAIASDGLFESAHDVIVTVK